MRQSGDTTAAEGKMISKTFQWTIMFIRFPRQNHIRGVPDYDHQYGLIRFDRTVKPKKVETTAADPSAADSGAAGPSDDFQTFQGQGFSLKKGRK